jgi:hypothetical protein
MEGGEGKGEKQMKLREAQSSRLSLAPAHFLFFSTRASS